MVQNPMLANIRRVSGRNFFRGGGPEILVDFVGGGNHLGGVPFPRGGLDPSRNYVNQ